MPVLWLIVGGMLFVTLLAHFFVRDFHHKIFQIKRSKLSQHQELAVKIHRILDILPLHYLPKGLKCLLAKKELLLRQEIMHLKAHDEASTDNFNVAKSQFAQFRRPYGDDNNLLPQKNGEDVREQLRILEEVILLLYQQKDIDQKAAKVYINYIGQLFVQNMVDTLKSDAAVAAAHGNTDKALELYDKLIKKLISGNDNNRYSKKISYLVDSRKQIQRELNNKENSNRNNNKNDILDEYITQDQAKRKW